METVKNNMSLLGGLHQRVYEYLCGRHPNYRPWHFQWLFLFKVHAWQRRHMKQFYGQVLDVGCGDKPYAGWVRAGQVDEYVGLDVGESADIVVESGQPWPIEDHAFDCILFTQVMEHLGDHDQVVAEMQRVLKPGGTILITVPFLFPVHGEPYDFARFTTHGISNAFSKGFDIIELTTAGGVGTVVISIVLTWLENALNANKFTRLLKGIIMPVWLVLSLILNMFGAVWDLMDRTETHYANVCALVKKAA